MPENTNRLFIDSEGPKTAALRAAFSWLGRRIAASPNRRGLLVVHGKGNLKGTIETVLGSAKVKSLEKDNKVQFRGGTLELMTGRIRPYESGLTLGQDHLSYGEARVGVRDDHHFRQWDRVETLSPRRSLASTPEKSSSRVFLSSPSRRTLARKVAPPKGALASFAFIPM